MVKKNETTTETKAEQGKHLYELAVDFRTFLDAWEDGEVKTLEDLDKGIRMEEASEEKMLNTARAIKNMKHEEALLKAQSDEWRKQCDELMGKRKGFLARAEGLRDYLAHWMGHLKTKRVKAPDIGVTWIEDPDEVVLENPAKVPAKYHVTKARVIDQKAFDAWAKEAFLEAGILPPGLILDDSEIDKAAILIDFHEGPEKGVIPDGVLQIKTGLGHIMIK
jgi:hypothetical protein